MHQSNKKVLDLFFHSSPIYAKFDTGFTVSNVIDAIDEELELQTIFESIEIIYQQTLNAIVEETKSSFIHHPDIWRRETIKKLKTLDKLPELNQEQFDLLRDLFEQELGAVTLENNKLPNIVLVTPSKRDPHKCALSILVCRSGAKSKTLPLRDLTRYHHVMPNLRSIRLYMMNVDINEVSTTFGDNNVEELDITFNTFTGSTADLLMYIFKSYQHSLKSLKLESHHLGNKKSKWDEECQEHICNREELEQSQVKLDQLKTIVIKNFYRSLPTKELIEALLSSGCQLKHASFIGLYNGSIALSKLLDKSSDTLENLSILSLQQPESTLFKGLTALQSLSLVWSNNEQTVDIFRTLAFLPHLTFLRLGYDGKHGTISHNSKYLQQYTDLNRLSLVNMVIKGDELSHLHEHIPNLTDIGLYNCKFGTSRSDMEATLLLNNYTLKSLVIHNGHLYYSKKDKPRTRSICKYITNIESNIEITGHIISKEKAINAEENISMLNNTFSYVCMTNNPMKQLPVLNIQVQLLEELKLDNDGRKAVHFRAVQDKAEEIISKAIEEQTSPILPCESMDQSDEDEFNDSDFPELAAIDTTERDGVDIIGRIVDELLTDFDQNGNEEEEIIFDIGNLQEQHYDIYEEKVASEAENVRGETNNTDEEDGSDGEPIKQRAVKRHQESDGDYNNEEQVISSSDSDSEYDDSRVLRRSSRVRSTIPERTRSSAGRKRMRIDSESETEEDGENGELKRFMHKVRNYRAIIRLPID